jgi:hypothetical protein
MKHVKEVTHEQHNKHTKQTRANRHKTQHKKTELKVLQEISNGTE